MTWVVPGGMWPVAKRSDDLSLDEVLDLLDQFDDYWKPSGKSVLTDDSTALLK